MKKILMIALIGGGIYFITKKKAATTAATGTTDGTTPAAGATAAIPSTATQPIVPVATKAPTAAGTETVGTVNTANGALPVVLGKQLAIGTIINYPAKIKVGPLPAMGATIVATVQGVKDANTIMVQVISATISGTPTTPTALLTGLQAVATSIITKVA